MNILIFCEHQQDKYEPVSLVYPDTMHRTLGSIFTEHNVWYATLDDINESITEEILADTDVMFWWGHHKHNDVPDEISELVAGAVMKGMGAVFLHSSHLAKPFRRLLGTSCTLRWQVTSDLSENLWVSAPYHPITQGIPAVLNIPHEEMYGEPFDIPNAEDIVFMGWFSSGNVFRSGVTFKRGYGKIFYFQPGHEEYPVYHDDVIRKILLNAANWAKGDARRDAFDCPNGSGI